MAPFTKEELLRYSRHLILPGVGPSGQEKLKNAKVLVVGAGGLGCPVLLYLAAAGVGRIGIVDSDQVEVSNLQRQIAFTLDDVGINKALAIEKRLRALNPFPEYITYPVRLTSANAREIIDEYDIVVDGTDNFPTRYLINDACLLFHKTCVHASVFRFEGHLSVFNHLRDDGSRGPNYRDLFPEPPPSGQAPNCAEAGVLGALTGILGSLQANEVIKLITGTGKPLDGKLLILDAATLQIRSIQLPVAGAHNVTQLIDYEAFCQAPNEMKTSNVPTITPTALKALIDTGADIQLIDVRESFEHELCNIGGLLIPMARVPQRVDQFDREKQVIVYCRSGHRSGEVVNFLQRNFGYSNLFNLEGGILAWSDEVDPSVPKY
ncbi:MAG: molybdopterin-synthase adenylyltransferase MoeB [Saprospirales bacterium]|nr:molybdopterin-synthase adenylyltransferase MoeB [Saprospirales bacterium]